MTLTYTIPSSSSSSNSDSGCYITRIIRRILCINTLPSSPVDHLKEEEKQTLLEPVMAGPGLVARLMGLETVPRVELIRQKSSMNSMDPIRKSRTSKIPAYQELEDENFFILSFDQGGESEEFQIQRWKLHSGSAKKIVAKSKKKKKRTRRKSCDKENQGDNLVSNSSIVNQKHLDSDENNVNDLHVQNSNNVLFPLTNSCEKYRMNGKEKNLEAIKFETEGDSENSSPNSVLEFVEFQHDPETASSGDISRLANEKLRRTLSEEIKCFKKSNEKTLMKDGCSKEEKNTGLITKRRNQNYAEKWDEIGKLVAMEMVKSSWLEAEISRSYYVEEICRDVASKIMDQLLNELLINSFVIKKF